MGLGTSIKELACSNPALSRLVSSDVFGQISSNSSINQREWILQGMMALISLHDNSSDQLDSYVAAALQHGATESEIQDLVLQSSVFYGMPRAVAAQCCVSRTLVSLKRSPMSSTYVESTIWVGDHSTMVRDSSPHNQSVPIVLIHALGLDRRMWDAVFDQLARVDKAARIISYDLRGHGQASSAPPAQSLAKLANDLRALLAALNVPKADVYGQSYGGAVAQYFALNHPQATRALGLVTTAGESQPSWVTRATRAEAANSVSPLIPETLVRWFTPEAIARNEWGVRYARSCVERISVPNWAAAWRTMSGLDTLSRMKEVECPILLVCGVQDASTGPKWMTRLREVCESSVYKEVDPGVHMMALEQGDALTKEILAFRAQVDGGKGA